MLNAYCSRSVTKLYASFLKCYSSLGIAFDIADESDSTEIDRWDDSESSGDWSDDELENKKNEFFQTLPLLSGTFSHFFDYCVCCDGNNRLIKLISDLLS